MAENDTNEKDIKSGKVVKTYLGEGCVPVQPNIKSTVKEDCFKVTGKNRCRSHLNYLFINARSLKNNC